MVLYIGEICKSKRTSAISIKLLYSFMPGSTYFVSLDSEVTNDHIPWWQAPRDLQEGSMWIFDFIDDPITKEKKVNSYKPLTEVLDLRKYKRTNPLDIIKELRSLHLSFIPPSHVYLRLEEGIWCGPISITRDASHKSQWMLNVQRSNLYVPIVKFSQEDIVHLPLHPERIFVSPWYEPGQPFSFVDVHTFELVYADNMPLENLMNLKTMEAHHDTTAKDTSQTITPLANQAKVQRPATRIEVVTTDFIEGAPATSKDTLADKKSYKKPRNSSDIGKYKGKTKSLPTEDQKKKVKLENIKKLENEYRAIHESKNKMPSKSEPLPAPQTRETIEYINVQKRLFEKARGALVVRGVNSSVAAALHAAFVSGMIPLISGKDAFSILNLYASTVVGGRLSHIRVTVPADVSAPPSKIAIPKDNESFVSSLGLTSIFSEARQHPDNLYLIVLDGINQIPFEECLAPLLDCYDNRWNQGNAFIPDSTYFLNRANRKRIGLQWPKNVLLAGIFVETSKNAKLPQLFWDRMVFIDLNFSFFKGYVSSPSLQPVSASTVPAKTWQHWCEENKRISATMQRKNWNLIDLDLSGHGAYLCQRVSFALLQILDIDLIDLYLLVLVWLPIAISSDQTDKIVRMIRKPQWKHNLFSLPEIMKMKNLLQGND